MPKVLLNRMNKKIVFIIGGPGSGKGTLCNNLTRAIDCCHFSLGDILRKASITNESLAELLKNGIIVPDEISLGILKNVINSAKQPIILIDGFPRVVDQAIKFEKNVCESDLVIFLDCDNEIMSSRILARASSSEVPRTDDNIESIRLRLRVHKKNYEKVLDYYRCCNKLVIIDATSDPNDICIQVTSILSAN